MEERIFILAMQSEKVSLSVYIVGTLPSTSSNILNLLVETTSSDLPQE